MMTARSQELVLPWWMWPAWMIGRIRSELRAATAADAHRLSRLPAILGSALAPAIAILVPAAVMALHATTAPFSQPPQDSLTLVISMVFTESLPVMAAMLTIGLLAPAAGALAVIVFAIGDLGLTVVRGELEPPLWALLARIASYWLLWVLAVEIPLIGRMIAEWRIGDESASPGKRWGAVAVGAVIVAALTWIWAQAAPLLIGVVFRLTTGWGGPTINAMYPLQLDGNYLVAAAAILGLLLLGLRYLGRQPDLTPLPPDPPSGLTGSPIVGHLVTVALTFVVLLGVVTRPIDVVVLLPALLLARPIATYVLRTTGVGPQLARLPMPIRLVVGFAAAVAIGWVIVSILGFQSDLSGFFTMVVALAVGYIVMTFFLAADSAASDGSRDAPVGSGVATTLMLTTGLLLFLALPELVLADNGGDHADGWPNAAAAALAAAAAGALAAMGAFARRHEWGGAKMTREEWEAANPPDPDYNYETQDQRYDRYLHPGERLGGWYASTSAADTQPPQHSDNRK